MVIHKYVQLLRSMFKSWISINDLWIFTRNLNIPKLHIHDLWFSRELWQRHLFLVKDPRREIVIEINTDTAKY